MATTGKRVPRNDGYGRTSRFYEVDGVRYPSVTTVLGAVNKPALVNWAAKMEREMVTRAAADFYEETPQGAPKMNRMAYELSLDKKLGQAKAYKKTLDAAADIGTAVHKMIEFNMRKHLRLEAEAPGALTDESLWAFMAYQDWERASELSPVFVEQTVYSKRYGYAGTLDWMGDVNNPEAIIVPSEKKRVRVVGDWKTGKGIYLEAMLQNAAYAEAAIEMGHADPDVAGMIVRLPKVTTDPGFEVRFIPAKQRAELFRVFLCVLELWKWMDAEDLKFKDAKAAEKVVA
jgi:hypothetical protein